MSEALQRARSDYEAMKKERQVRMEELFSTEMPQNQNLDKDVQISFLFQGNDDRSTSESD